MCVCLLINAGWTGNTTLTRQHAVRGRKEGRELRTGHLGKEPFSLRTVRVPGVGMCLGCLRMIKGVSQSKVGKTERGGR